jgi:hypothetical protein
MPAPYSYGVASGFSKSTPKTFEYLHVADNTGDVKESILKYTRTETTSETVDNTVFGAPTIGTNEVLNATITYSADEQLIEPRSAGSVPPAVRQYNPRAEASATVLGEFTASTFTLDSIVFKTLSQEKSETSGDVVKTNLRGIKYGEAGSLTLGSIASGGTIRVEKRFSNTDFVRNVTTTVAFAAS